MEGGRESDIYRRFLAHLSVDRAVAALGEAQHCVMHVEHLEALGLRPRAVQHRAAAGRLHRVYRGVYSLVPPKLLTREGRWLAAVFACGPGAVLSHRSAGVLHGLRDWGHTKIEVTIRGRSTRSHDGILVHRSKTLTETDVTVVDGIPCTTVARTQFDLAEVVTRRELERVFDQAEVMEAFDLGALQDQIARNPTRPAAAIVRSVLEEHYIGRTPTRSELEEAGLAMSRACGLADPETNVFIDPGDGERAIEGDLVWRQQRIIIQLDGERFHHTRQAFERDRRNDQRLLAAGWLVIRVTWRQLKNEPERVRRTILKVMAQARVVRPPHTPAQAAPG
jgi:hypothetical protein